MEFLKGWLAPRIAALGLGPEDVDPKASLTASGLIDSSTFIEMIVAVEGAFGFEVDFSDADPAYFTTLDGFAASVAERVS